MGYVEMDVAPAQRVFPNAQSYEKSVSVSSVTTSDWVLIPADVASVAVTLVIGSCCTAKVETCTDMVYIVKTGSPTAIAWDAGLVTATTQDMCIPCTAVRINQTIGTNATTLKIRAQ